MSAGAAVTNDQAYGCTKSGLAVRCGPMPEKFNSLRIVGSTQPVYTVNQIIFEPVDGIFGNALEILGYKQQFLSVPNKPPINLPTFSISFWMKQNPAYFVNSSIISHTNFKKTAGWFFSLNSGNSEPSVVFSVPNSDGIIFSASTPVDTGTFENVVGTFDGDAVKIYLDGILMQSIPFAGKYNPDPNAPLNVGLNSYDLGGPWNGAIDEIQLYNKVISEKERQRILDNRNDGKVSNSPVSFSKDGGLVAYWPFDEGTQDKSGNQNDGNIILQAVSMAFSPDGMLFFSVRDAGEIRIMMQNGSVLGEPFVRLQDPNTNTGYGILGITVDPDFSTNRYVYAYYTVRDTHTGDIFNRVARFTESENRATDERILVDNIPSGNGLEYAGALAFGPDDKLYITTDSTNQVIQDQRAGLTGKVLRINRDGTIPTDNPFPNSTIYTEGHSHVFGIAFDSTTGTAIVTENDVNSNDEVNVLTRGGDYAFLTKQDEPPITSERFTRLDDGSDIKPSRIYYKIMTPAQAIYYDGNKFPTLKGKFLVASHREGSIYALSLNKTGNVVEEVVIRLPEIQGHIISIAKAPNGDLYVGGESIYKLISVDTGKLERQVYFVNIVSKDVEINDLLLNLKNKVMSIDFTYNTNNNDSTTNNEGEVPPSLQVTIPKALLGTIDEITSERDGKTSIDTQKVILDIKKKENRRVTNVGDTIIDIQLKSGVGSDKILIKGQTSTLVQSPSRNIIIHR